MNPELPTRPLLRLLIVAAVATLIGCSGLSSAPVEDRRTETPAAYRIKRGDTLYGIAWQFGVNPGDLIAWNNIRNPNLIYAGELLKLRGPSTVRPSSPSPRPTARPPRRPTPPPTPVAPSRPSPPEPAPVLANTPSPTRIDPDTGWRWPMQGQVLKGYRPDLPGGKGIQITGTLGQAVHAVSPGTVVYRGSGLPGYGRLIILKHSETTLSAYGYLGEFLVNEGDSVRQGQPIAELGTSSENRPVLHFEIRENGKPVDPMRYLPG